MGAGSRAPKARTASAGALHSAIAQLKAGQDYSGEAVRILRENHDGRIEEGKAEHDDGIETSYIAAQKAGIQGAAIKTLRLFKPGARRITNMWRSRILLLRRNFVLQGQNVIVPWSFSPGGRQLAYLKGDPETGSHLWTLQLDLTDPDHPKPGTPEPFLRTHNDEVLPQFSPDGHWIAYRSNESGSGSEIYVRPYPNASGGRWPISSGGGLYAFWSKKDHELFYETADNRIMVVDYSVNGGSFVAGKPRLWSDKQLFFTGNVNLDLAPDGKRFAVLALPDTQPGEKGTVHVTMLLNFFDELKRRIPAK